MVHDLSDHVGLGDESNDSKFSAAVTNEGVGFVDSSKQIRPPSPERGTCFEESFGSSVA